MVFGGQDIQLIAARTLDDAVREAKKARPDLVIADAALGGSTGYDLCAAVKGDPQLRGVPVYVLASSHVPYDENRGSKSGADGHLIKPFDSQQLIDRINGILAAGPVAAKPVVSDGAARPMAASPVAASPVAHSPVAYSPAPARPSAAPAMAYDEDDDYGEITIER